MATESWGFYLLMAGIALLIGLSKGGLGAAVVGVITPTLSLFMPVPEAVAMALPFLIIGDWMALPPYWKTWDEAEIRWLMPPMFIGVIVGSYLLVNLPGDVLRLLVGIFTTGVGIYKLLESRLRTVAYQKRRWHTLLTGGLAGFASAIANAGGSVLTAYLLLIRQPPRMFIGTTTLFFIVSNHARIPALLRAGLFDADTLPLVILFAPLVWIGVWLGRRMIDWIDPIAFERLMVVILIGAGLILVIR